MSVVQVKFDSNNQIALFKYEGLNLKNNLTVIVDSSTRGLLFGKVVSLIKDDISIDESVLDRVVRISTKKDYLQHLSNVEDARLAIVKCKELVKKNELSMTILDANYNFDRSQLVFRFVADERIDFRQLARELGSFFRTRIELRQVGIRDKAKEIGGLGPCGRKLCCSSFLTSFDSVSINMAKNQAVSLNPSKINGVCGRLLCCLKYENEMYSELKESLPVIGSNVSVNNEFGKVVSVDVLKNKYKVMLDNKCVVEVDNNGSKE